MNVHPTIILASLKHTDVHIRVSSQVLNLEKIYANDFYEHLLELIQLVYYYLMAMPFTSVYYRACVVQGQNRIAKTTHPDFSWPATWVSYYAVTLWFTTSQSTVEGTMRVPCSYCMCSSFSAFCHSSIRVPHSTLNGTATCSIHRGTA